MNPQESEDIWGDIEREWRSTLPAQDQIEARVTELSSTLPSLDDVKARLDAAGEAMRAAMREVREAGALFDLVGVLPIIQTTLAEPGGKAALTAVLAGDGLGMYGTEEAVRRGWMVQSGSGKGGWVLTPSGKAIHHGYRQIVGALRGQ
jgi:hypothetical protein